MCATECVRPDIDDVDESLIAMSVSMSVCVCVCNIHGGGEGDPRTSSY